MFALALAVNPAPSPALAAILGIYNLHVNVGFIDEVNFPSMMHSDSATRHKAGLRLPGARQHGEWFIDGLPL